MADEHSGQLAANMEKQKQEVAHFKENRDRVGKLLDQYRGEIAKALPKVLTPDRMIRTALTAMTKRPELLECTSHSLIACILTCSQLGLMPDDILGEAYLIPFNNTRKGVKECQLMAGYKGLCTLAYRSGQVKSITAVAVFHANKKNGDKFKYELGLNEVLEHKPAGLIDDPAMITHFYAVVKLVTGGHVVKVMTRKQVEAVRNDSKNYQYAKKKEETIWGTRFEEMGLKTVLRRALKYVPLSPEVSRAIGLDEAAENGIQNVSVDVIDTIPEFTEDITHEVLNGEASEKEEVKETKAEQFTEKAANATSSTLTAIRNKMAGNKPEEEK